MRRTGMKECVNTNSPTHVPRNGNKTSRIDSILAGQKLKEMCTSGAASGEQQHQRMMARVDKSTQ